MMFGLMAALTAAETTAKILFGAKIVGSAGSIMIASQPLVEYIKSKKNKDRS